jgi:O-methyltransferase
MLNIAGGGENIPLCATESFDFLYAEDCLANCAEPYNALANWLRVIRPGGHLAVQAPPPDMDALLGRIAHLAVPAAPECAPSIRILSKRQTPITPTDSQTSEQAILLGELMRGALDDRRHHPDIACLIDILGSGGCGESLVDSSRLYMLYQWLLSTRHIAGDCIEVGCYKGGSAKLISESILSHEMNCAFHIFDTFDGMPDALAEDEAGFHKCFSDNSLGEVQRLLSNNPHSFVHQGVFPDSASQHVRGLSFRFAHIDVDIERSVADCCAFIYPRLAPGGVMLFDDYADPYCPGAARAVDAFFADRPDSVIHLAPLTSAVVIKRA